MMPGKTLPILTGVITLIDPREEFYTNFLETKGMDLREQYGFNHEGALALVADEEVIDLGIVDSRDGLIHAAEVLAKAGSDLLILNMPGWTPPGWGGLLYTLTGVPVLINASFALSGPMAMRGELAAIGADAEISFGDPDLVSGCVEEARARKLAASLKGIRAARIGGFSMNMHYAEPGPAAALRKFGVDIDPVDGSRILLKAGRLDNQRIAKFMEALKNSTASFPEDTGLLESQVSYYLALKDLAEEENYAFMSLQCQPEFSDYHGALCMAASFLPSPVDPEGEKRVIPVSCEGDFFAALSCYLLYRLSGQPPFFGDLILPFFDDNTIALQNCGGASVWHSCRSDSLEENLSRTCVVRNLQGKSISFALDYIATSCSEATLFSMGPKAKSFWAAAEKVEIVERTDLKALIMEWPTIFIKASDARGLLNCIYSQHIGLVPGDYNNTMVKFEKMLERGVFDE